MEDMTVINSLLKEALWQPVKSNHNHDMTVYESKPQVWELQEII